CQKQPLYEGHIFAVFSVASHNHGRNGKGFDFACPRVNSLVDLFPLVDLLQNRIGGQLHEMKALVELLKRRNWSAADKDEGVQLAALQLLQGLVRRIKKLLDADAIGGEQDFSS